MFDSEFIEYLKKRKEDEDNKYKKYVKNGKLNRDKWRKNNPDKIKLYRIKYKDKIKVWLRNYTRKRRLLALKIICGGEIKCTRCGCDDIRFLEINHKNGGGTKEYNTKRGFGHYIVNDVVSGKRKTDDLEILCKPCNHIHYLEMKYKEEIPLITCFVNNDWEKEL